LMRRGHLSRIAIDMIRVVYGLLKSVTQVIDLMKGDWAFTTVFYFFSLAWIRAGICRRVIYIYIYMLYILLLLLTLNYVSDSIILF
jgi:hypothetical protein